MDVLDLIVMIVLLVFMAIPLTLVALFILWLMGGGDE